MSSDSESTTDSDTDVEDPSEKETEGENEDSEADEDVADDISAVGEENAELSEAEGCSSGSESGGPVCSICLNRFIGQELGSPDNCLHIFCLECIYEWSKKINTCPIDRIEFKKIHVKLQLDGDVVKKVSVPEPEREVEGNLPEEITACEVCHSGDHEERLLLCDACDLAYHCECLSPPLIHIPINEWFCPSCAPIFSRNQGSSSHTRRVIARTLVSETVRSRIQRQRAQPQQGVASTSTGLSSSRRAPKKRVVRRRRRKRRQVAKPKLARTLKSVGSLGKGKRCATTGKRTQTRRKRRKTRRKRKTVKRTQRSKLSSKRLAVPSSKSRIAEILGLCKPPPGHAMPYVKKGSNTTQQNQSELGSFSLFGNKDQLMDFEEDFTVNETASSSKMPSTTQQSHLSVSPVDVLGSIMSGQKMLHTASQKITIGQDGSLQLKNQETVSKKQVLSKLVKKEIVSVKEENSEELRGDEKWKNRKVVKDGSWDSESRLKNKVAVKSEQSCSSHTSLHTSVDCSSEYKLESKYLIKSEPCDKNVDEKATCVENQNLKRNFSAETMLSPDYEESIQKTNYNSSSMEPNIKVLKLEQNNDKNVSRKHFKPHSKITSSNDTSEELRNDSCSVSCIPHQQNTCLEAEPRLSEMVADDELGNTDCILEEEKSGHEAIKLENIFSDDDADVQMIGFKVKQPHKKRTKCSELQNVKPVAQMLSVSKCDSKCVKSEKVDNVINNECNMKWSKSENNDDSCVSHETKMCSSGISSGFGTSTIRSPLNITVESNTHINVKDEAKITHSFGVQSPVNKINQFSNADEPETSFGISDLESKNIKIESTQEHLLTDAINIPFDISNIPLNVRDIKREPNKLCSNHVHSFTDPVHMLSIGSSGDSGNGLLLLTDAKCLLPEVKLKTENQTVSHGAQTVKNETDACRKCEDSNSVTKNNHDSCIGTSTIYHDSVKRDSCSKEKETCNIFSKSLHLNNSCDIKSSECSEDYKHWNQDGKCFKIESASAVYMGNNRTQKTDCLQLKLRSISSHENTPKDLLPAMETCDAKMSQDTKLVTCDKVNDIAKLTCKKRKLPCEYPPENQTTKHHLLSDNQESSKQSGSFNKALLLTQIENAVKQILKPHFYCNLISKEEYKEIMKRSVPKILKHSRSGVINLKKIHALITDYLNMYTR